ncbi:hypothetical protein DesyoDRAFT_1075 [Desulfosporosinus youngiae DSM 17734]|uniref:Uncharacterized protein n=1 Tax=Desulfosporosinus youngiae DSM 17734 TaxID=768710 RepID=H5Y248_9FIRM|nr:hypothetical protein DesyoDRAFT_1075 [Desulfosporosinus youngiae DSM 17734]
MKQLKPGDFVKTPLGKGFVKKRYGGVYLVQHGGCRFAFRADEITVLQTREDRAQNGPHKPHKLKVSQS